MIIKEILTFIKSPLPECSVCLTELNRIYSNQLNKK
jgi:hypothetical protein